MAAYEKMVDSIQARLKEARESIKGINKKRMPDSYKSAMDEIKKLENRLRVAKAKVPKKAKKSEMSASERARQGLPPVPADKKPKTKVKNEKTSPPKTEEIKTTGTPFGGKKFGGKRFGGKKFGGKRFGASSDPYENEAEREAAKKDAQILKDIRTAEKQAEKETKEAKEAKKSKSKVPAGISEIKDDRSGRKYKAKRKKERETKQTDDIIAAQKVRGAVDKMSAAERKSLGPVTNFMEKLLGLNRDKATIERDMKVTEDLEKELGFSGGKKRGGRVYSPPRKKYAMNRGGMASLRKPTRA